jgi:hypothetical protein
MGECPTAGDASMGEGWMAGEGSCGATGGAGIVYVVVAMSPLYSKTGCWEEGWDEEKC